MRLSLLLVTGGAAVLVLGSRAHAAPPRPKPAVTAPAPAPTLAPDTLAKLRSGDAAQIKSALDDVRMAGKGGAAAAPAIAELLRRGLDAPLTQSAIDALGDTEAEAASEAIAWYTRHRAVAIRRAAVAALARTKGARAVKALRAALSDGDAQVRGAAATGLGALKAKEAVGDLFDALDHKVSEAAVSIGQLCAGPECEKLASKLGGVAFDVVTSGLDQILFRQGADVSDDTKVKIVGRVRELGTAEANRFLREVQKKWPDAWSKRIKQAIDQAVLATSGAAGGTP